MASGSSNGMFTDDMPLGSVDIEAGHSYRHVVDVEKVSSVEAEKLENVGDFEVHVSDIDRWADSLKRILEDVPQYMCRAGHPGRISRIPETLREIDPKAYEPYYLSIGPYHNGKPMFEHMENRKRVILKYVLKQKPELSLQDYLREILNIEPEVRRFYSDVDMDSEKFAHMLLLDSMFILTTFFGMPKSQKRCLTNTCTKSIVVSKGLNAKENKKDNGLKETRDNNMDIQMIGRENRPIEETRTGWTAVPRLLSAPFVHDLFLLENQIPFFLLQKMLAFVYGGPKKQFIDIMKNIVGNMFIDYTKLDSELVISATEEIHHLLHLCHMFFRPTIQHEPTSEFIESSTQMFRLGSATQLYESGVSFVAKSDATQQSLLDIAFCSSGKLSMPCLYVDDNTNALLRNLIALEQMKYPSMGLNVSAYAVLLLHLVTKPEDVGLLRRKGILHHHLSSDKEMMYLVNRLSMGLAFDYMEDKYCLKPVFQELKKYSDRRVPKWRAWLKHRHCNNPWTVISLLTASLLLFLTGLQTYYTVYSFYYPCFSCHS